MIKSMFAGVSGLRAHQSKMDVIGNNIANVNTNSFKAGRATFRDSFYSTMSPSTDGDEVYGGGNSNQVGYGSAIGSVDVLHTRGSFAPTDNPMDVMIEGNGYFMVGPYSKDGYDPASGGTGNDLTSLNLTRVGIFGFDGNGALVDSNRNFVYGYKAYTHPTTGEISYGSKWVPDAATPPVYTKSPTKKLETIEVPDIVTTGDGKSIKINGKSVKPIYTDGAYDKDATYDAALLSVPFKEGSTTDRDFSKVVPALDPATDAEFKLLFDGKAAVVGPPAIPAVPEAKLAPMKMDSVTIGANGVITGVYDDEPITIGQIAIANVPNPNGLEATSGGYYKAKHNTGDVTAEVPGEGSTGGLHSGGLEMANVDLAKEFSDMITTQRGFQANTRIITVSDEMLQELVNLKR